MLSVEVVQYKLSDSLCGLISPSGSWLGNCCCWSSLHDIHDKLVFSVLHDCCIITFMIRRSTCGAPRRSTSTTASEGWCAANKIGSGSSPRSLLLTRAPSAASPPPTSISKTTSASTTIGSPCRCSTSSRTWYSISPRTAFAPVSCPPPRSASPPSACLTS